MLIELVPEKMMLLLSWRSELSGLMARSGKHPSKKHKRMNELDGEEV